MSKKAPTSFVGCIHSLCWKSKLVHQWTQLSWCQSTAEHAQSLSVQRATRQKNENQNVAWLQHRAGRKQWRRRRGRGSHLLELRRAERVVELLWALKQRLSGREVRNESLLHLRVGQDGGHDLRRQDAGEVHCRGQQTLAAQIKK